MASSYYDLQSWQLPQRQPSWDQGSSNSRPGASSSNSREDTTAFGPQFEEVDRAIDNLLKSGKLVGRGNQFSAAQGRPYSGSDYEPRQHSRPQSIDFDPMRSQHSNNLQNFYGNARYPPRSVEGDPMHQAKRRMAAQRERELRNYHQEQQYNRGHTSQGKSDRSESPSAIKEEDRRDLLARQHKALYGDQAFYDRSGFNDDNQTPRASNPSMAAGNTLEDKPATTQDSRSGTEATTSPATNSQNFGAFDQANTAQQSSRTSTSSPGESPPRGPKPTTAPGAIGTRPAQAINPAIAKRATPPASSPLSFGFANNENNNHDERSGSSASNPAAGRDSMTSSGNWGTGSGVWGKGSLSGVSSTVWG